MLRKVALVGCKRGHWIRTAEMGKLQLNARIHQDTTLLVTRKLGDEETPVYFTGPGFFELENSSWVKVDVLDGPHMDVIVVLEGRVAA